MKTNTFASASWLASLSVSIALLALALVACISAQAANGTWTNTASGGLWSAPANWINGIVADGVGFTANFNTINLTSDNTVHMDAPHKLTSLTFGDTDATTAAGWILDNNGNSANILTLTNGSTITVNALGGTSVATISAVMTGTNGWSKAGAGVLSLTAVNTFSNVGVTISAGTLSLNAGGGALPGSSTINVNADTSILDVAQADTINTVTFANAATASGVATLTVTNFIRPNIAINKVNNISCALAGTGALLKTGQGTTVLSGVNSYTGGNRLNGSNSKLTISGSGTLGSTSGTLVLDTPSVVLDLGGTSQTVGTVMVNGTINNGTLTGTSFSVTNGAANVALAGSGAALTKTSASTFTLAGVNTYSGNSTVSEGTLTLSGSIDNSPVVSVASGATFNVPGAFTVSAGHTVTGAGSILGGTVTVNSGGTLAPGGAGVCGTLTVAGLTLDSGATNIFEFPVAGANDQVNTTGGTLTINGGKIYLYQVGTTTPFAQGGVYNLFQYTGSIGGTGIGAFSVANPQPGVTYTFDEAGGFVRVTIASSAQVYWNVDADGSWATAANWLNPAVPNAVGANPNFGGGGTPITAPRTVSLNGNKTSGVVAFNSAQSFTIDSGTPANSVLTLDNTPSAAGISDVAGNHTIVVPVVIPAAGVAINVNTAAALALNSAISGSGAVTMTGNGSLTLAGANTYNGGTIVLPGSGTLTLSGSGTLGNTSGALTLNGGTLDLGGTSQTAGPVTIAGATVQNGTLTGTSFSGQSGTVSAALAGSGTILTKTAPGILTLSGANIYTGSTIISAGTLVASTDASFGAVPGAPAPTNLVLNGGTLSSAADFTLDANRGVAVGTAGGATSGTVDITSGLTLTIAGSVANSAGGTNGLNVNPAGTGTVVLSGTNTYTGGTILSSGTLTLQGDQSAANGGLSVGNNALAASSATTLNIAAGAAVAVASGKTVQVGTVNASGNFGTMNVAGFVTNNGSLYVGRPGILNLNTGAVWLQTGDLTVQGAGNFVATMNVNAGATLTYTGTNTVKLNNNGTGFNGANVLTVAGTFTTGQGIQNNVTTNGGGNTTSRLTLNGGTLALSAGIANLIFSSTTAPIQFTIIGGATTNSTIDTGVFHATNTVGITGNGSLVKQGAGALTFTGTNTYSGNTIISNGTLALRSSGSIASSPVITVNGTFDVTAAGFTLNTGRDLNGTGTVNGNVTLADNATATLHPGSTNTAGTLTFGNNLTFGAASRVIFDCNSSAGSGNDRAVLTNDSAILAGSGATITINQLAGVDTLAMADYLLFDLTGASGTVSSDFNSTPAWLPSPPANASSYYIATVGKQVFLRFTPLNGNVLTIETAANGSGTLVGTQNVPAGNTVTGYAIERTAGGTFVANQPANWALFNLTGGVVSSDLVTAGDAKSANFTGHIVGSGQIRAAAPGVLTTTSGTLNVMLGAATQVWVETQPDGSGTLVPAQTLASGSTVTGYAVTRDAGGNYLASVTSDAWSLANVTGSVVNGDLAGGGASATFTAALSGAANIRATFGALTPVSSGLITVTRGLIWAGLGADWDTATANWYLPGFTLGSFIAGDSVTFDETGGGNPTVNLVGSLSPLSVTVSGAQSYTLGGTGKITGAASLTHSGTGTLTVQTANDYSGGTTHSAGLLRVGANSALGTGLVTLSGGQLSSDSTTARTLTNAFRITSVATFGDPVENGVLTTRGAVDFGNAVRTLIVNSDVVFAGGATNGGLNKTNAGTLTLNGLVDLNQQSDVFQGMLILDGATATDSQALRVNASSNSAARLIITNGASLMLANAGANLRCGVTASTTATNYVDVAGTVRFPNANSTSGNIQPLATAAYSEVNLLTGGDILARTIVTSGTGTGITRFNFNGGILRAMANSTTFCQGLSNVVIQAGGAKIDDQGFAINIPQALEHGGGGLTKSGTGRLTLSGTNTYTSLTTVSNGTLRVTGSLAGGVAVETGATLDGAGAINGAVMINAGATLSPGNAAIGRLTINSVLTLNPSSQTLMEVNKSTAANDAVAGLTTVNYGGSLTVSNLAGTFVGGENYQLFSASSHAGNFVATNLPTLPTGLGWTWNPTTGTLAVVSTMATTPTNITYGVSGSTLTLTWPSSYLGWYAQSNSVNVATPEFWSDIAGSQLTTNLVITVNPAQTNVFYRLRLP